MNYKRIGWRYYLLTIRFLDTFLFRTKVRWTYSAIIVCCIYIYAKSLTNVWFEYACIKSHDVIKMDYLNSAIFYGISSACFSWYRAEEDNTYWKNKIKQNGERSFAAAILFFLAISFKSHIEKLDESKRLYNFIPNLKNVFELIYFNSIKLSDSFKAEYVIYITFFFIAFVIGILGVLSLLNIFFNKLIIDKMR